MIYTINIYEKRGGVKGLRVQENYMTTLPRLVRSGTLVQVCFSLTGFRTLFMCMYVYYHFLPYSNLAVNTVLSLIIMCNLLPFKHFQEED